MEGYAKVAKLMSMYPEFAVFRRFQALNIQNLLYLQAEIIHLEDGLKTIIAEDAERPGRRHHSQDWWSLSQDGEEQWESWLELRTKLEKYNDMLLKVERIAKMEGPRSYDIEFLRSWFSRPTLGSDPILGIDKIAWDSQYEDDLVGIKPRTTPDTFSHWFTEKAVPFYHHFMGEKFKKPTHTDIGTGICHYKESFLAQFIRILTTVVASILPICSVVVLYMVQSLTLRLSLVVVFSACFSLALVIMTNGRTIEVFVATAAFAAVNVVFLTNSPTPVT